jgi:hypothetical protein
MHGMVMLEVLGQLHLPTEQADALVASMVARMSDELEAAARGEPDRVDPEQEPISAAEGR